MSGWHHSARDWPEDQRYFSRCLRCNEQFAGPKRAPYCWPHWQEAEKTAQAWLASMVGEYGPFSAPKLRFDPLSTQEPRP